MGGVGLWSLRGQQACVTPYSVQLGVWLNLAGVNNDTTAYEFIHTQTHPYCIYRIIDEEQRVSGGVQYEIQGNQLWDFHSYAGERWQECEIRYCDNGEARKWTDVRDM